MVNLTRAAPPGAARVNLLPMILIAKAFMTAKIMLLQTRLFSKSRVCVLTDLATAI